jgi:hypothetical protein
MVRRMRFEPFTGAKRAAQPVALIRPGMKTMTLWSEDEPGGWVYGGNSIEKRLRTLEGHRIYCTTGVTSLRQVLDARSWTATVWKGRASSMRLDGTKVVVNNLRGALDASPDPWEDLNVFLGWLAKRGISPATVGTMATNLWRSTLSQPVVFDADPLVATPAFFGGRQEATPGNYRHLVHYDLRAAYPHSMSSGGPYAQGLRRCVVDPGFASVEPGLARASVNIDPHLRFGPLPTRAPDHPEVVLYPTDGTADGIWSLIELEEARHLGCHVYMHEAWLPTDYVRPFDEWWKVIQEARQLPGGAGVLGKMVGNTLWGTFAMEGELTQWKWSTKHGTDVPKPVATPSERRNLPHTRTRHLAVETTARVRVRLTREGLYGSPVPPLHVDTDGIIVRGSAPIPTPAGDRPGQWREKWRSRVCEIVAPQTYRYTCGQGCNITHPKWHYISAGRTPAEAREHWRTDVGPVRASMVIEGQTTSLNTVLERRLAAARIAQSMADMSVRRSQFPELSSEEQARMMA